MQEQVLQGEGQGKVALVPVRGVISNQPSSGTFGSRPSLVQEVEARLALAAQDDQVGAVVLLIDSPGGTVTASDVLHRMLREHRKQTGQKVVVCMLSLAASGGYYIAADADWIVAHPTTITGSIGTIFLMPKVNGLMDKLGLGMEVYKSGQNKDMGSMFRQTEDGERQLLTGILQSINARFLEVVRTGRNLTEAQIDKIRDARIMIAQEAKDLGLVDQLGYLDQALKKAKELGGLSEDAKVVAYGRGSFANNTIHNTMLTQGQSLEPKLMDLGLLEYLATPRTGYYYLWAPEYLR